MSLALDADLHKTNNFAPNEYRGVVNSSGLVVYKGSNARDKKVLVKVKAESKLWCEQWCEDGLGSRDFH